jgi:hypothetical protein
MRGAPAAPMRPLSASRGARACSSWTRRRPARPSATHTTSGRRCTGSGVSARATDDAGFLRLPVVAAGEAGGESITAARRLDAGLAARDVFFEAAPFSTPASTSGAGARRDPRVETMFGVGRLFETERSARGSVAINRRAAAAGAQAAAAGARAGARAPGATLAWRAGLQARRRQGPRPRARAVRRGARVREGGQGGGGAGRGGARRGAARPPRAWGERGAGQGGGRGRPPGTPAAPRDPPWARPHSTAGPFRGSGARGAGCGGRRLRCSGCAAAWSGARLRGRRGGRPSAGQRLKTRHARAARRCTTPLGPVGRRRAAPAPVCRGRRAGSSSGQTPVNARRRRASVDPTAGSCGIRKSRTKNFGPRRGAVGLGWRPRRRRGRWGRPSGARRPQGARGC